MNFHTNIAPQAGAAAAANDDALTALAAFVKVAINSSLSVDELKTLGRERLETFKARAKPTVDEFDYDINALCDASEQHEGSAARLQAANSTAAGIDDSPPLDGFLE